MPVGATCSVAVAVVARVHPRRWSTGMVLAMRRLARRNNSSNSNSNHHNHHNHHHKHSNGNNLDNNVEVQTMVPKTVSPNADNARWRGIERGRMTFIMLVGRANACAVSFVITARSFLPFIHFPLVVRHSISRSADRIVYHHVSTASFPTPTSPSFDPCLFSWLWWCYSCVVFIFISRSAFLSHYVVSLSHSTHHKHVGLVCRIPVLLS